MSGFDNNRDVINSWQHAFADDVSRAEIDRLAQQVDELRETNRRLNRRAQIAEAAAAENVEAVRQHRITIREAGARFMKLEAERLVWREYVDLLTTFSLLHSSWSRSSTVLDRCRELRAKLGIPEPQ